MSPLHAPDDHESSTDRSGMSASLLAALAANPEEIAHLVSVLATRVTDHDSLLDLMHQVAMEAVRLVDGVRWAGVTAQFDGAPFTAAHTDSRVLVVDEGQYACRDGPCLRAMRTDREVHMNLAEIRWSWPALGRAAEAAGVQDILAEPVRALGVPTAVLNMYSPHQATLHEPDRNFLEVLTEYLNRGMADYCATNPDDSRGVRLRQAIHARQVIEQAQGILIARHELKSDEAADKLTRDAVASAEPLWRYASDLVEKQGFLTGDENE